MKKILTAMVIVACLASTVHADGQYFTGVSKTRELTPIRVYSDLLASVNLSLGAAESGGLVICSDGGGMNKLEAVVDRSTGHATLTKTVAGVDTTLIDVAVSYSAGAPLTLIKHGTDVWMFYNGTQAGALQSVSDGTVIYNKRHHETGSGSSAISTTQVAELGYGVRWDSSASSPAMEKGFAINGTWTQLTYTSYPIQERLRRCLLLDDGSVNYYLSATDSTKKADDSAADLTGADGQVMGEIPQFQYVRLFTGDDRYFVVGEADFSLDGTESAIHPAFYKGGSSTPVDYRYIGAYEGSMYDASAGTMTVVGSIHANLYASGDKLCSVSGQYPKTAETIVEFRAMAAARGSGWHQFGVYEYDLLSILYLTEYGNWNSQAQISNGRTGLSNGDWVASEVFDGTNYGYIGITGLSNALGNASGGLGASKDLTTGESFAYSSYRVFENIWGNVWVWLDGANIHNSATSKSRLYLNGNHTTWGSDTATGYTLAGVLPEADGWATGILDAAGVWPSVASGGGNSTYLCDYYYTFFDDGNDSGWRVARVGGSAYFGSHAGAFCVGTNYGSADANSFVGGRLCF
jgi:hypothetical protein